jgi:transposase InsO family protein
VVEHFRSLTLRLNNEQPNYLKAIQSDNGTEFRNTSFDQFYLEHSVDQQLSAPRVPQQNEIVEVFLVSICIMCLKSMCLIQ